MRTRQRLTGMRTWLYETLCKGREMKAPSKMRNPSTNQYGGMKEIVYQEPQVYLAWNPTRPDTTGLVKHVVPSVTPGIIVMPTFGNAKYVEEKHFDRYNHIKRGQEYGQDFNVTILMSVYEPGVRLPGYVDLPEGEDDMHLLMEGSDQGLFTLCDWMDDAITAMLSEKMIPGTDLTLIESELVYSPYTESGYVSDKRPIYYGFINAKFVGYAEEGVNESIDNILI